MTWKRWIFPSTLLLLSLAAAGWASDGVPAGGEALRAQYRRPAEVPYPDSNPYSAKKAELGRKLFFDPIFSASRTISCESCHNPGLSWGDGLAKAHGQGILGLRAPTLLDVAFMPKLGWDGKFRDLEAVAFAPITGAANMGLPEAELIRRLQGISGYVNAFADVFDGGSIDRRNIELALATYERSIVSTDAPFDKWIAGEESAIGNDAKRGFELFNGKGRCAECHSGWTFSDGSFHDIGTAQGDEVGRGRFFPTSLKLRYAFKTPTLRDVAHRAPYMHDGSVPTLEAVIDLYDKGGIARPSRSELIAPLGLTPQEKHDLIAFLQTLTSAPTEVAIPVLPR